MTLEPTAVQKKMLADFRAKSGAEFDKELMEHVRKDHEKGIHTFADAAADSKDADIKAFAAKEHRSDERTSHAGGRHGRAFALGAKRTKQQFN